MITGTVVLLSILMPAAPVEEIFNVAEALELPLVNVIAMILPTVLVKPVIETVFAAVPTAVLLVPETMPAMLPSILAFSVVCKFAILSMPCV